MVGAVNVSLSFGGYYKEVTLKTINFVKNMTVEILSMKSWHLPRAIKLANSTIPTGVCPDTEKPAPSFIAATLKHFPLLGRMVDFAAPLLAKVNARRCLEYYVAVDSSNSNVVGTSGIYAITGSYIKQYGVINNQTTQEVRIDDPKHFHLSWLGVDETRRREGIGKKLVAACVGRALEIADKNNETANLLIVISTPEAEKFYENLGLKRIAILGESEHIFGQDLRELAMKLDAKAPEGTGIPKDLEDAHSRHRPYLPQHFPPIP